MSRAEARPHNAAPGFAGGKRRLSNLRVARYPRPSRGLDCSARLRARRTRRSVMRRC